MARESIKADPNWVAAIAIHSAMQGQTALAEKIGKEAQMSDPDYNRLSDKEQSEIGKAIHDAMCSTDGDTGPITLTARQVRILFSVYKHTRMFCRGVSHLLPE